MKIGIVGAGISGLVAAYLLQRRHEITIFEANDYAGGHTHTVEVADGRRRFPVDTGFIVFNRENYPLFTGLLARLAVPTAPSDMSFSVQCERTGDEWSGDSLAGLFASRRSRWRPAFYRMLAEVALFNRDARRFAAAGDPDLTLGEFLVRGRYSSEFITRLILPMGAALWSTAPQGMAEFPALAFTRFFTRHALLDLRRRRVWRTVEGGAWRYVEALTRGFGARLRLGARVTGITRGPAGAEIAVAGSETERFERIVLAVHADQALALLAVPTAAERAILGAIPYQENRATLHTDDRLLPRHRPAWASWNCFLPRTPRDRVTVTYFMNRLQKLPTPTPFCVTLNREEAVAPAAVHGSYIYHHPTFTRAALRAQGRFDELAGANGTYYCGAYWGSGFHEDGVASAVRVAGLLGGEPL
jgi:predicted NAD/FAD-binding protein